MFSDPNRGEKKKKDILKLSIGYLCVGERLSLNEDDDDEKEMDVSEADK